jgi:hypothetical protein
MRLPMTILVCVVFFATRASLQTHAISATAEPAAAAQEKTWATNGASACKKFLTADFLSSILTHTSGDGESRPDGHGCAWATNGDFASLLIELSDHVTADQWERYNKEYRRGAIVVTGVGDRAVRTENPDRVSAWKHGDRTCNVMLTIVDDQPKLVGEALAKKLGGVCNQLFALP